MKQTEWEQTQYQKSKNEALHLLAERRKQGATRKTRAGESVLFQQLQDVSDTLAKLVKAQDNREPVRHTVLRMAATRINNRKNSYEDYDVLAYIGLTTVLNKIFHENPKMKKLTYMADKIGGLVEMDQRLHLFNKKHKNLHHILREELRFKLLPTSDAKAVYDKWDSKMEEWTEWTTQEKVWVGSLIIRAILECMPDYIILNTVNVPGMHKRAYIVDSTLAFRNFIQDHDEYLVNRRINGQPCVEQPQDWVLDKQLQVLVGGFHTEEMKINSPFCKVKSKVQREFFNAQQVPYKHVETINYMQSIAWEVNEDCLEFVKQAMQTGMYSAIPSIQKIEYGEKPDDSCIEARKKWSRDALLAYNANEKNCKRLLTIQQVISIAEELKGRPIWFVYNTCFRGRAYCCSNTLDTQGRDYVRSLIRFRKGKPLGKPGLMWLAVHGANKYGNNKISYTSRYRWIMDNMDSIRDAALSPNSSRGSSFLRGADKPFQFYAFCREWTSAHKLKDPEAFISHLPVGLDGSGNGFQHISALLCDRDGAARVNLLKTALPSNIYGLVYTRVCEILTNDTDNPLASELSGNIDINLIKSIVLTIPYGATNRGISSTVVEYIIEHQSVFPKAVDVKVLWSYANYITDTINEVSKDILAKPRELMKWFKTIIKLVSEQNKQICWISPVEFPICQNYVRYEKKAIRTSTSQGKAISLSIMSPLTEVNKHKAMQAISANFTHSMDSSHMVMTALAMKDENLHSSYVHDEYNTHACDVPFLFKATRDTFAKLYTPDNLESFRRQVEVNTGVALPPPPEYGDWDCTEIHDATYFFG